ncbi:MAG: hypothetical protein CVT94_08585 [Bacteroidetes bacterium HGW-Bacteroidetes-11]|jgi:hypothetical protein|nr:MAG: hypothetical protein CVT94_08585 [Bacteroidetes bacterium HGW-Bacteroidetes-11]
MTAFCYLSRSWRTSAWLPIFKGFVNLSGGAWTDNNFGTKKVSILKISETVEISSKLEYPI